jgi:hypothetical protein
VDAAVAAHKNAVDAAKAKAKADCASGVDAAAIRTALRDSLKAANDAFRTSVKRPEDLDEQVKALRTTRDASIRSAIETFKTEFETAKTALKTALGR